MSKLYKPNLPFKTAARHIKRSAAPEFVNGVNSYSYTDGEIFQCSAKSYGGTEKQVNGVTVIEDTWLVETWYNPAFQKHDKIRFLDDNSEYEILASPENINREGVYMKFKVSRIGG